MRVANTGETLLLVTPEGGGIGPEEETDELWALDVARELDRHYPGHPWRVSFSGGALVVRHDQIGWAVACKTGRQGFGTLLPRHRQGTRLEVLEAARKHAGELLEAFGMPRGAWREDCPPICPDWKRGKTQGFT